MKDLILNIQKLKREKNAIILAHNYQIAEVQDIADFSGDSLELSRKAAQTDASVIVFCGVRFMAETAAILSPRKKVLIPDINAGCPLADTITSSDLRRMKNEHPDALVVAYVNSSADVKAEADYCCTSGNAVQLVNALPKEREIIFVPDKYLGLYTSRKTGRNLILSDGSCPFHTAISTEDILRQKNMHPEAKVIVHPECRPEVINLAEEADSTAGMCRYAMNSDAKEIIIGTEVDFLHRLKKDNSDKLFYPASESAICITMKLINLKKILHSLEEMKYEITIPAEVSSRAKKAVDRMMEILP